MPLRYYLLNFTVEVGKVYDASLDLCIYATDEPSHISGYPCTRIPSFGLVIR
jgi:hypothetical protein